MKILGVIFDPFLKWDLQTEKVSRSCNLVLINISILRDILSSQLKLLLVNSCVLSILNYAFIVWGKPNNQNYTAYKLVLKQAARFVLRKRRYDSVSEVMFNEFQWLKPELKLQYELLCFAYSVWQNNCPDTFRNYIDPSLISSRQTRNRSQIICPNSEMNALSCNFLATKAWLEVFPVLESITSFNTFKKAVYDHLLPFNVYEDDVQSDACDLSCIDDVVNYQLE
jgi:hypothetical protein